MSLQAAKSGIDFETLPWNLNLPEEHSYVHITTKDVWSTAHYDKSTDTGSILSSVKKYGVNPMQLYPATTSLNYGTTIWEGLKCFRDVQYVFFVVVFLKRCFMF